MSHSTPGSASFVYNKKLMHKYIRRHKLKFGYRELRKAFKAKDPEFNISGIKTHNSKPKYKNINRDTIRKFKKAAIRW